MDLQLKGKTAIVTGGGSNIGRAISLAFGREGANLVIADIDQVQGDKIAAQVNQGASKAICIKTDVTSLESVQGTFKRAVEEFGQVHVLVNNVGWDIPQYFLETDPAFWERVISLNYRNQLNAFKTVLPHMIEHGYGRVVSIGSDAGRVGEFREAVYSGCKAGVIALSKALAREVGRHNITLNVVCPGFTPPRNPDEIGEYSGHIATGESYSVVNFKELESKVAKGYALRRLGSAEDIANAVVFLASEAANYITGQTLSVSGGYSMV